MLKTLDILIGLSVVMLVLSMVVTLLTQFVISVANSRGRHLKNGLADLLKQIDPLLEPEAERIAHRILTHPVIRETNLPFVKSRRMGSVIQREEFTKLLLELAAGEGPHRWDEPGGRIVEDKLANVLAANGITNPGATLASVREHALRLEISDPKLANSLRQSIALLKEAASPLTAKINAWFDQLMDRTSDRFTYTTRGVTFVCAAMVALVLQVDTVGLVNRLAVDQQLRNELTQVAETTRESSQIDKEALSFLNSRGLITLPEAGTWSESLGEKSLPGIAVSVFLLSLGAPFWYSILKQLINLRPVLARKEDQQREQRQ